MPCGRRIGSRESRKEVRVVRAQRRPNRVEDLERELEHRLPVMLMAPCDALTLEDGRDGIEARRPRSRKQSRWVLLLD